MFILLVRRCLLNCKFRFSTHIDFALLNCSVKKYEGINDKKKKKFSIIIRFKKDFLLMKLQFDVNRRHQSAFPNVDYCNMIL